MELPEFLKIGAMTYSVRIDGELAHEKRLFGELNPIKQEIVITGGTTPEQQGETLLHEIIEAINNHCELGLRHHQIQVLGFMIHQVLRESGLRFSD